MKRGLFFVLLLMVLSGLAWGVRADGDADRTVHWIARALTRMGETQLAERFLNDYYERGVIHFVDPSVLEGDNAKTGVSTNLVNEMDLSNDILRVGGQNDYLLAKPYGENSLLIPATVTVFHEYQHMDQTVPTGSPRSEEPAWTATRQAVERWTGKIRQEYEYWMTQPDSIQRSEALAEILDIAKRLKSEVGSWADSMRTNKENGLLSSGYALGQEPLLRSLDQLITESQAAVASATPAGGVPKITEPSWVMVRMVKYESSPPNRHYRWSIGSQAITMHWGMGGDVFAFNCTWSAVPRVIRPSDVFPFEMSVAMLTNEGERYSANGAFSVYWDSPDVRPGSVIRPQGLSGPNGASSNLGISHNARIPVPPKQSLVLTGAALGAGQPGQKIALVVEAYNGRAVSIHYIFEWKTP